MRRTAVTLIVLLWACHCRAAGDAEPVGLVKKAIAALGGEEGFRKRRLLSYEQIVSIEGPAGTAPAVKAQVAVWIKGEKMRIEQRVGDAPGAPIVIIYDGKDLFVLIDGQRRDPGLNMRNTFEAGKLREDIWWNWMKKPFDVRLLGDEDKRGYALKLLEFTHPKGEKTTVGLDAKAFLPVYVTYDAPHPYTGKTVRWTEWRTEFEAMEQADGLKFPKKVEIYNGEQKLQSAVTTKLKTEKDLPDSLFGQERPVD